MKIQFSSYSAVPIGDRLAKILELLAIDEGFNPRRIKTSDGEVLEPQAAIEFAARSPGATLQIETSVGSVTIRWMYGSRASWQRISGLFEINGTRVQPLAALLAGVSKTAESVYTFADLDSKLLKEAALNHGATLKSEGLLNVYWFNYYGPHISRWMAIDDIVRRAADSVGQLDNGAIVLQMAAEPNDGDYQGSSSIASKWPFFQHYSAGRFPQPLQIDFSQVRERRPPPRLSGRVSEFVGNPQIFIENVASLAAQFDSWMTSHGKSTITLEELERFLRANEHTLTRERLIQAIASYGEKLRLRSGGCWRSFRIYHSGEPVVVSCRFPFVISRPVHDVLELIS